MTIFFSVKNIKPFFKIIFPLEQQRFLEIPENRSVIGRGLSADIRLNDELVSREHCEITNTDSQILFRDMGSTNGTFINFMEQKEGSLRDGDKIQIGASILKVVFQESSDLTESFTEHSIFSKEHFLSCAKSFVSFAKRNNTSISLIDLKITPQEEIPLPHSFTLKFHSIIQNAKNFLYLLHSPEAFHFQILISNISEEETLKESKTLTEAIKSHRFFWNDTPINLSIHCNTHHIKDFPNDINEDFLKQILEAKAC